MIPRPAAPGSHAHYRRWTLEEDNRLERLWGETTLEAIAGRLGRSAITTYWRARKLGLPCGCPQGFEYLAHAAARTGFTTGELRALLPRGAVRRTMSAPGRGAQRSYHCVEPDVVDEAVAVWNATEIVNSAALRRGITGETLRGWLEAAGETPPKKPRARWRVATATIDRVVAARRAAGFSVRAHAARLAVSRQTLAARLRAAGVLGEKRGGVEQRLPVDVVDAVLAARPLRRCRVSKSLFDVARAGS